jgi:hypothetical protein
MVSLDVPHVFRVFRGPRGLLKCLERHQPGHGLRYNQVQMWQQRNAIPSKYVGAVIYCVEQEGHQCREFLVDRDEFVPVPPAPKPDNRGGRGGSRPAG